MLTITGPMRSGTSIVARIAHQMGIDMGTSMRMPPAGSGLDPEYEDQLLADVLTHNALGRYQKLRLAFRLYLEHRKKQANGKPWGFKSPLLALYWNEWTQALEQAGEPLHVVVCERPGNAFLRSLTRIARNGDELETLLSIQQQLLGPLESLEADLVVDFGTPPATIAAQLAELVGLERYYEATAIRGIRR